MQDHRSADLIADAAIRGAANHQPLAEFAPQYTGFLEQANALAHRGAVYTELLSQLVLAR